jgi:hypothetical protein
MSFFSCPRQDDPFTRQVRDTYGANVVSAPRSGIDPLSTLAVRGRKVEPRGQLKYMLEGRALTLPSVTSAPTAELSGVRSATVDVGLGLSLSAKFLAALGVPVPGAEVSASLWEGASKFTFEVRDVIEHQVDIGALGQKLKGHVLARTAATELFLVDPSIELMLITRTLTTPSFAMRAIGTGGQAVHVAVDGIAELIGKANADVSWRSEHDNSVTFTGATPVTFAFAAVPCAIDPSRNLMFGLTRANMNFAAGAPAASELKARPTIDKLGLLSFDELLITRG